MATSANKLRKEKRECIVLSGAEQGEIIIGETWTRGGTAEQAEVLTPRQHRQGSSCGITQAELQPSLTIRSGFLWIAKKENTS